MTLCFADGSDTTELSDQQLRQALAGANEQAYLGKTRRSPTRDPSSQTYKSSTPDTSNPWQMQR